MSAIAAVVFDLGGVVMESPLHAIARYERDHDIAHNSINHAIVAAGEQGAWSRLERGELDIEGLFEPLQADCRRAGIEIDARRMMEYIAEAGVPRPRMIEAIRRIRERELGVAALTNNWAAAEESDAASDGTRALAELFDVFVESSVEGLRKPDPRIYELTCERLAVDPARAAFLDDIGYNLKPARALGMTTIKVDEPVPALEELGRVLGLRLLG